MNTAVVLVWHSVNTCVYIHIPVLVTTRCTLCLNAITLLIDDIHHRVEIYMFITLLIKCI